MTILKHIRRLSDIPPETEIDGHLIIGTRTFGDILVAATEGGVYLRKDGAWKRAEWVPGPPKED